MKKILYFSLCLVLFMSLSLAATSFKSVGSRASAMGGAYTALGGGVAGMYYNPATLYGQRGFDFNVFFNIGFDNYINQDVIDKVDDLIDIIEKEYTSLSQAEQAESDARNIITSISNDVNNNALFRFEPNGGLGLRIRNFGFYTATNNVANIGVYLEGVKLDNINIEPDTSYIYGYGAMIGEFGISYGFNLSHYFFSEFWENFNIGITLKGVGGFAKYVSEELKDLEDFVEDDLEIQEFDMNDIKITADIGFIYKMFEEKLILGLVGKNLTGPTIKPNTLNSTDVEIKIDPMIRFGVAYKPFSRLTTTLDLDLTKNTIIPNLPSANPNFTMPKLESQNLCLGVEIKPFNLRRFDIPLRFGYSTNLAESNASDLITGGIGIHIGIIKLELAGGIDSGFDVEEREKFGTFDLSFYW